MNLVKPNWIKFEGIVNARDLGGYPVPDGRRIREKAFIRGGDLGRATDADIRCLEDEYRLNMVFDFRTEPEVIMVPDRQVPGAGYINLPAIDPEFENNGENAVLKEAFSNLGDFLLKFAFQERAKGIARDIYPSFVRSEYTQLQYAAFLNRVVSARDGAVMFHCSQGKDRTGLAAAFLLGALGVEREVIVEDFDMSNIPYKAMVDELGERVAAAGGGQEEMEVIRSFVGVSRLNFERTLDIIDREYGSLHDYVVGRLLFSEREIFVLKDKFLV